MAHYKNAEFTRQSSERLYPNIGGDATNTNLYPSLSEDENEHSPPPIRRSKRIMERSHEFSPKHNSERQRRRKDANVCENKDIRKDFYMRSPQYGESAIPHKEIHWWTYGLIALILLSVFFLVIFLCLPKGDRKENVASINFGNLKSKFKIQSNRVWNVLKASTNHILAAEEPDRPAVIMMVLPNKESQHMALCLAQHLSHDINRILKGQATSPILYPFINGTNFINYESSVQKLRLDNSIQGIIKQWKSVIIAHLEKFHSQTVMLFHGLCDTTEAKHKRIAIIFLLETSYEIKNEAELTLYLENLWSDMDSVRIKPLLSRLANNVILLNEDKSFKHCL